MIYLSRLILDPRSRLVRRDLMNCQDLHRTIMRGFPAGEPARARQRFGVLYRLEAPGRSDALPLLIVQSCEEPDWATLPTGYLADPLDEPLNPAVKRVDDRFAAIPPGAILRFRLRANPTKKIDTKTGPDGARNNGRRIDLHGEDEQVRWLARKGEEGGFRILAARGHAAVPNARLAVDKLIGFRRTGAEGESQRLTFGSVLFDGTLVVTDTDRFLETLARGVGPGKAYGFGLLSVAPA